MKWKIALISEHASPLSEVGGIDAGGQNIAVAELAQQLAEIGYEIDIFTRRDNQQVPEVVNWVPGVRVIHIQAGPARPVPKETLLPLMDEFTDNLIRFSRRERHPYRLVHAHFFMSALVASRLKTKLGIPFVVTFHALGKVRRLMLGETDLFPQERTAIEEQIVREADQLIALCPQERQDLIQLYGADPNKIVMIPNGFNPRSFYVVDKHLARLMLGLDPNEIILLHLGRMVPRKGIDNVVRAAAQLRREHGIWTRLLIVGGDSETPDPELTPEIGRLQQLAKAEDIADWVTFVGRRGRDQLRYFYSAADVFVTTPLYEPFGLTPLEAMACGVPVVGSNVGGIKHTIVDGQSGFLVPPNDPAALAAKLLSLIQFPRLQNALRGKALRRVHKSFTWMSAARTTAQLYERFGIPQQVPTRPTQAVPSTLFPATLTPNPLSPSA